MGFQFIASDNDSRSYDGPNSLIGTPIAVSMADAILYSILISSYTLSFSVLDIHTISSDSMAHVGQSHCTESGLAEITALTLFNDDFYFSLD